MTNSTHHPTGKHYSLPRIIGTDDDINKEDMLLSRQEAAAFLGISPKTLAIWAVTKRYQLEMVKIGRLAKYRKSALNAFIERRTIKS